MKGFSFLSCCVLVLYCQSAYGQEYQWGSSSWPVDVPGTTTASITTQIWAELPSEVDASYAYASITEEGVLVADEENTCLFAGSYPIYCSASASHSPLTDGCRYCYNGRVRGLFLNPYDVRFELVWDELCYIFRSPNGGGEGDPPPDPDPDPNP